MSMPCNYGVDSKVITYDKLCVPVTFFHKIELKSETACNYIKILISHLCLPCSLSQESETKLIVWLLYFDLYFSL